jgi:hypothetical protein
MRPTEDRRRSYQLVLRARLLLVATHKVIVDTGPGLPGLKEEVNTLSFSGADNNQAKKGLTNQEIIKN